MRKIGIVLILAVLASCNYRSSIMFKTPKNYEYAAAPDSIESYEYTIQPNDVVQFKLFTNDGFKLIDLTTLSENINLNNNQNFFNYIVEHDGQLRLPMIGRVMLKDKTIREAEKLLEEKYSQFYIKPYVQINVINRRAYVFFGRYSEGQVVPINNNNTTLLEGLALAGGLPKEAKAFHVKVIRGNPQNPMVYHYDLSTLDGIEGSKFILEANDIIYVDPRISLTNEFIREWAPIISLTTSVLTLYILIVNLNTSN